MNKFKKIFAILLVASLGTVVACGDDDDKGTKANNTDQTQTDTGTNGSDTGTNDSDTGTNGGDDTKQLKDLSAAELSAFCTQTNKQESVLFDPSNEFGKTNCLINGSFDGYFDGEDEADAKDICELSQADCLADPVVDSDVCMNPTDCTATVAEFDKCTLDYIASEKALLAKFAGKTCADYTTEAGYDAMIAILDSSDFPASCEALETKCPKIFELEDDTE